MLAFGIRVSSHEVEDENDSEDEEDEWVMETLVRGHSFWPSSQTEYLRPTTPDTFRPCNTPYVPSHHW